MLVIAHFHQQVPRRKLPANEKPLLKEENKIQNSSKKGNLTRAVEDPDQLRKHRSPVVKKTADVMNSLNLGNFVKVVPSSSRRWKDGSVSWSSLPSSLAELGKVCI